MLVGMLKNSSLYNPMRRPEMVRDRRNVVFMQMERNEVHHRDGQRTPCRQLPLELDINLEGHSDGTATYFREYVREFMRGWMKNNPKAQRGELQHLQGRPEDLCHAGFPPCRRTPRRPWPNTWRTFRGFSSNSRRKTRRLLSMIWTIEQVKYTMRAAMKRSDRWRKMKQNGVSDKGNRGILLQGDAHAGLSPGRGRSTRS